MPQDPTLDKWRQNYVKTVLSQRKDVLAREAKALIFAQNLTLDFYHRSSTVSIIKSFLTNLHLGFRSSEISLCGLPFDGEIVAGYTPAFILKPGISTHYQGKEQVPGFYFSFYIGLDETVIRVSYCLNENSEIFPYIHLTHRYGRTHKIDCDNFLVNPTPAELTRWLDIQIATFTALPHS